MTYDVIIIGGSYAGLSAGLQLARARCKVLVVDSGVRRNRFANNSHGFLGQDGGNPTDIALQARAELLAYPTVKWLSQSATGAHREDERFAVKIENGTVIYGRRLILATGVTDELPKVPGLKERWGKQIFHCPYCHGYELNGGKIGVLAATQLAVHHALMLPDWGPTTLFLNDVFDPDADQLAHLKKRGVNIVHEAVASISGEQLNVNLASGRTIRLAGIFTQPKTHMASPLAELLGCEFEAGPMGDFIKVDAMRQTSVPGIFACGDVAVAAGNVATAVGDGARTGAAVHQSLIFR